MGFNLTIKDDDDDDDDKDEDDDDGDVIGDLLAWS